MNQNIYTVENIRNKLSPVFSGYNVRSAVLFGSYAKGLAQERSDIDLLVDSGLKGMAFFGLLEDVSNTLNLPVDLIDSSQVEPNSRVLSEINSTGVLLYGE